MRSFESFVPAAAVAPRAGIATRAANQPIVSKWGILALLIAVGPASALPSEVGHRRILVSARLDGRSGNSSSYASAASADGRRVAFESLASDLVDGDTNEAPDIFVRDLVARTTERVSLGSRGEQAGGPSRGVAISADGRMIAFSSLANNLVPGDSNRTYDVFVRDRLAGTTTRVSVANDGAEGNNFSLDPSISADGSKVAFMSLSSNLTGRDRNTRPDVFVRDLAAGTTIRASVDAGGGERREGGDLPSISGNGRSVAFVGRVDDENGFGEDQVLVFDLGLSASTIESVNPSGEPANGSSWWFYPPRLSFDGDVVVFNSYAGDLTPGDSEQTLDVFVRDRRRATTSLLSIREESASQPAISAEGRGIVFVYHATVPFAGVSLGPIGEVVFVRLPDRSEQAVSRTVLGYPGSIVDAPAISGDASLIVYSDYGLPASRSDRNFEGDVYGWRRET